jgi:hypothetical protein
MKATRDQSVSGGNGSPIDDARDRREDEDASTGRHKDNPSNPARSTPGDRPCPGFCTTFYVSRTTICACTRSCATWRVSGRASSGHAHPARRCSELPRGRVAQGAVGTLPIASFIALPVDTAGRRASCSRPIPRDEAVPRSADTPQLTRTPRSGSGSSISPVRGSSATPSPPNFFNDADLKGSSGAAPGISNPGPRISNSGGSSGLTISESAPGRSSSSSRGSKSSGSSFSSENSIVFSNTGASSSVAG